MPAFNSPEPITADLELGVGDVRIVASERADTVVEVRPSDPNSSRDVKAAEETKVSFDNGRLRVVGKKPKWFSFGKKADAVDITIELPSGSTVSADSPFGDLDLVGTFGEVRVKTAFGAIRAEETGPLYARTAMGTVDVGHVVGRADISTGSGEVRVHRVEGEAEVKNSHGISHLGRVDGDAVVKSAAGDIRVEYAAGNVSAKTAAGKIRLDHVERGEIEALTSVGTVEVGVKPGVPAWLDVDSTVGRVSNELGASEAPAAGEQSVRLRLRSTAGNITIRYAIDEGDF